MPATGRVDTDCSRRRFAMDEARRGHARIPSRRVAKTPDERSPASPYVLSDDAAYVNGAVIDAGRGIRRRMTDRTG